MSSGVDATAEAYRDCEAITRAQAANFYYGIRLLPHDRRQAMCAVYAFARRVDDIGDGALEREEKLHRLDAEALALAGLGRADRGSGARDPVILALADTHERFALAPAVLGDLIEGVRMDVNGVTYERFEDLVLYCRRVAGAVGRACLAIFAVNDPSTAEAADAEALADDLGVALQLTNILAGQGPCHGSDSIATGSLHALVRFEANRAQEWFRRGMELAPLLDRRSAACVLAMAGIYHRLLDRIEAHPERALHERMSLPGREKAWVALRSMLGGGG